MNYTTITHPRRPRNGLGDTVSAAIGVILDAAPVSPSIRKRITSCANCARRRDWLNARFPSQSKAK